MVQDLSHSPFCWHNFNKRFYVKCGLENMTPSFRERVASILFDMEGKYLLSETKTNSEIRAAALAEILSLVEAERTTAYQAGVEKSAEIASEYTMNKKVGEYIMWKAQAILNEIGEDKC